SEDGIDIGAERRRPSRRALWIAPACPVRGDVALGASSERHRLGRVELRLDTLAPTDVDRIEARRDVPCGIRALSAARLREVRTEPISRSLPASLKRNTQLFASL